MITGILLALTSAWAWALPFVAPFVTKAGILLAGARSALPRGIGSQALGLAVAGLLGALLVWRAHAWLFPPPRTYTAAEIQVASAQAENADLRRALDERLAAIQRREVSITKLAELNDQLASELEAARAKSLNTDAVLVPADDPWLREWHRRGW